jgi:flagellar FliL protein
MADKKEESTPLPELKPAKKGGSKLMMIVIAIVVLGAGGGGAWWFMRGPSVKAEEKEPDPAERGLVAFEPFLVNLADPGGGRFLKATIQVVVGSKEEALHLKETPVLLMQARSAILELLTLQTADTLVTPEGKQALKDAIKERIGKALGKVKVVDVLFSEFVVQF